MEMENKSEEIEKKMLANIRVRLIDHQTRREKGTQGVHYVLLKGKDFNSLEDMLAEKKALMDRQKAINDKYDSENGLGAYRKVNTQTVSTPFVGSSQMANEQPRTWGEPTRGPDIKPDYMSSPDIKLDVGTGNTILLVASSKAGKTTLQMKLYEKYFMDYITVMFAQNSQLPEYKMKNLLLSDEFLPKLIDVMRKVNKASKNKFDFCCMFDDMLSLKSDKSITDLFLSLRNSKISSVLSLQYLNLLSKACRGNVNWIFAGFTNSDENTLVFIRCYLGSWFKSRGVSDERDMIKIYRDLTSNHGFFVIKPADGIYGIRFLRLRM